jgi:hypothetical protein
MSEHHFQDNLEEREDVVDSAESDGGDEPNDGEPWAKTSSGNADDVTTDG